MPVLLLLSRLPFRVLYLISDLLYVILCHAAGYRKAVVRRNLAASFPEKTPEERRKLERRFYRHLCDVMVETIKLLTIKPEELMERVTHDNPALLLETARRTTFITMAPHYGNWEWMLAASQLYMQSTVDAVYKPLHSPFFERFFLRIRTRFGAVPIPGNRVLRMELERRGIQRCIAMVADQTPGPEGAYITRFLHQPTVFFKGPQKLARKLDCPVLYAGMRKTGRGRYALFVRELAAGHPLPEGDEILERFVRQLEDDIRQAPEFWLWSHKRWKYRVELPSSPAAGKT